MLRGIFSLSLRAQREGKGGQRMWTTPFRRITNWEIYFPVETEGRRSGSWKANKRTFLCFQVSGEKQKEKEEYVVDIDCFCPSSGHSTTSGLYSSVGLTMPTGPEVGMWPSIASQHTEFCWLHWWVQWWVCNPSQVMQCNPITFTEIIRKDKRLKIFLVIHIQMIDAWSCWELPGGDHLLDINKDEREENWVLMIWRGSRP